MPEGSVEDLHHRRDTRRRNRRIVSGAVAFTVAAVGAFAAFAAFRDTGGAPRPADPPIRRLNRLPPPSSSFQFVDDRHGWMTAYGDAPAVLATSDGGKTWRRQNTGSVHVLEIQFVDANHGWAVSPGGLLRTTDGGAHWMPVGKIEPPLRHVHFLDRNLGWAISGGLLAEGVPPDEPPNRIMRTTDGGVTWDAVPTPLDTIGSICFANNRTGWAGFGTLVFRTTDGGKSWDRTTIEINTLLIQGAEGYGWNGFLRCVSESEAWLPLMDGGVAGTLPYVVFRSVAGGEQWEPVLQERSTSPVGEQPAVYASQDPHPGPFDVVGDRVAYFVTSCPPCGQTSAFNRTTDSGRSWERFNFPQLSEPAEPSALSFIDKDIGWVMFTRGESEPLEVLIAKTSDGGRTWSIVYGT